MKTCEKCNGSGQVFSVDIAAAQTKRIACPECGGRGSIVDRITDGVIFGTIVAQTGFWQHLKDGHVIATLEIRVRPVCGAGGKPLYRANRTALFDKDRKPKIRIWVEIVRMTTVEAFRRQGIMEGLVRRAIADPRIEWAETNIGDSTEEGIALLSKIGFKEEGAQLVYEPQPD